LIDLPTNKDFNELIKRKSEKMVFQKRQIRDGSSPNPVPMNCVLVLNNDGNESKKLKIKSDILWRNDGVPVIAADFGGNAFVKALSCGGRIGADYIVGDMDSSSRSKEEDEDDQIEETRKKKRRTLFQKSSLFVQGEEEKWVEEVKEEKRENVPFVNREQLRKLRFDDDAGATTPNAAATAEGGEKEGIVSGELIDLSRDQDTNDMEKCLNFILERGKYSYRDPVVSDVVIFNAMGGRFDHEFANISAILKAPGLLKGGPSYVCYDAYDNGAKEEEKLGIQISFPIRRGYTVLKFKVPAKSLGIFPFNGKTKVWTSGLKWNLENNKEEDNAKNYEYFEMGRKISSSNETTFEDESRTKVTDVHVRCDKDVWFTARIQ
jgi:thiamine pyrophosphokinase